MGSTSLQATALPLLQTHSEIPCDKQSQHLGSSKTHCLSDKHSLNPNTWFIKQKSLALHLANLMPPPQFNPALA